MMKKLPRISHAALATVLVVLAGCSGPAEAGNEPGGDASTETFDQLAFIQGSIQEWQPLEDAAISPLPEGTEAFPADRLGHMSETLIDVAMAQLELSHADPGTDMEGEVHTFIDSAPGMLQKSMMEKAEKDADDAVSGEPVGSYWWLSYIQPIDSTYPVSDSSRFTSAWSVVDTVLDDQPASEVTLSTRTAYALDDADDSLVLVARWLTLRTVDPEYAAESGDYGWALHTRIVNGDVCSAVEGGPLTPYVAEGDEKREDLQKFVAKDADAFIPYEEMDVVNEAEMEMAEAECMHPSPTS